MRLGISSVATTVLMAHVPLQPHTLSSVALAPITELSLVSL